MLLSSCDSISSLSLFCSTYLLATLANSATTNMPFNTALTRKLGIKGTSGALPTSHGFIVDLSQSRSFKVECNGSVTPNSPQP